MTQREAMTPIGLPAKVIHRIRLKLLAINHPVLMRYIEETDESMLGPAIAAFAEEGIRARLGMGATAAAFEFLPPQVEVQHTTSVATEQGTLNRTDEACSTQSRPNWKFDKEELSEMFPQYGDDEQ